jgi:hypothetical protein
MAQISISPPNNSRRLLSGSGQDNVIIPKLWFMGGRYLKKDFIDWQLNPYNIVAIFIILTHKYKKINNT